MSDAGDVEDGIIISEAVETGMVAEWTLGAQLVETHIAFEDDLGVSGHFEIDGLAFHQLDGLLPQEAGDDELFDLRWSRDNSRKSERGLGANGNRDLQFA